MAAELDILIQVRDEATRALRDLNREVGQVGRGGQQAGQQLGTMEQSMSRAKAAAVGFGVGLAASFGPQALGALKTFIGSSISAASDLEESMSKTNVVFGESSDEIVEWSKSTATSIGQSQQQALEAASTFGNLFTAMGLTGDAAAGMSMNVVELASDLASFNNIGTDEALEKLRAGLVGEVEPLRTLGVQINAAAVEAKALEMGLGGVTGELTEAEKVQARYALIMEQTTTAQGDFARTSDGLANQQRILQANIEEVQAAFGQGLTPAMALAAQTANTVLVPGLKNVGNEFTATSAALGGLIAELEGLGGGGTGGIGLGDIGFAGITVPLKGAKFVVEDLTEQVGAAREGLANFGLVSRKAGDEWSEFNLRIVQNGLDDAGIDVEALTQRVIELTQALHKGRQSEEAITEARKEAGQEAKEYAERIRFVEENTSDLNRELPQSVDLMIELRDGMREATSEGHRHNQMLDDMAGAYDAATVDAAALSNAMGDLAAVNDIMNQRIQDSAGAISHWESRVSDVDTALGYLDEQLKIGNITQEEHARQTGILTEFKSRLAGGIEDDLIPAFVDEQLAAANLQKGLDDLDQALKDGTISQQEHAQASADLRAEFEEQKNPVLTLIEKIGELIDKLIELEDIDPEVEITANAEAIKTAIEDMRQYAKDNPINVPMYGTVAGGNDAAIYIPSGGAGTSDQMSHKRLRRMGFDHGSEYGRGFGEGAITEITKPPTFVDGGKEAGRDFGDGFTGEFKLIWSAVWTEATQTVSDIFQTDIGAVMDGSAIASLQAGADAARAFMDAWIEMGFSQDAPAFLEAKAEWEAAMQAIAMLSGFAGTDAAQEFYENWLLTQHEWFYPEFREEIENFAHLPEWGEAGTEAGQAFGSGVAVEFADGQDWRALGDEVGTEIALGMDDAFNAYATDGSSWEAGFTVGNEFGAGFFKGVEPHLDKGFNDPSASGGPGAKGKGGSGSKGGPGAQGSRGFNPDGTPIEDPSIAAGFAGGTVGKSAGGSAQTLLLNAALMGNLWSSGTDIGRWLSMNIDHSRAIGQAISINQNLLNATPGHIDDIITGVLSGTFGSNFYGYHAPGSFAMGTNFAPGGWAWVGEQGPELMRVPRGSQVRNSQESAQMAAPVVHVYLDSREISATVVKELDRQYRNA